jgi:autoinducer 2-degrading protein
LSYVVIARWVAKVGSEDAVAAAIQEMIEPSRAEPGCLQYRPNRGVSDGRVFLLYEEYVDEAAYRAHTESDHFARHALGEGIPLLELRDREFYTGIEQDGWAERVSPQMTSGA